MYICTCSIQKLSYTPDIEVHLILPRDVSGGGLTTVFRYI